MSIANVILFCSSSSPASMPCLKFIKEHNIPVSVVRLDTLESRERAAKGKFIQISSVPTLVVVYQDNNVQQFIGQDKVIKWLANTLKKSRSNPPPSYSTPRYPEQRQPPPSPPSSSESEEEEPIKPVKRRKKKPKKSKKKTSKKVYFEPEEEDEDEGGSSSEEVDIEYFDNDDDVPPKASTQGLRVGSAAPKPSTDNSVFDIAKEMERQRKETLSSENKD